MFIILKLLTAFLSPSFACENQGLLIKPNIHNVHFKDSAVKKEYNVAEKPIKVKNATSENIALKPVETCETTTLNLVVAKLISSIRSGLDQSSILKKLPANSTNYLSDICIVLQDTLNEEQSISPTYIQHKKSLLKILQKLSQIKINIRGHKNFEAGLQLIDQLIISFVHIKSLCNYREKQESYQEELLKFNQMTATNKEAWETCEGLLLGSTYVRNREGTFIESQIEKELAHYNKTIKDIKYNFLPLLH